MGGERVCKCGRVVGGVGVTKRQAGRLIKKEKIAEVLHDVWMEWSKEIASSEDISFDRYQRWVGLWVPYKELNNEMKEQDRQLAERVLQVLESGE
jgi:hypothetical protein